MSRFVVFAADNKKFSIYVSCECSNSAKQNAQLSYLRCLIAVPSSYCILL